MTPDKDNLARTRHWLHAILRPERNFIWVIIIYGIGISLLTLAVPAAVQYLINTIVNIGSFRAVLVLAFSLFLILLTSGVLSAIRMWVVELYERRIFARLTSEISFKVMASPKDQFKGPYAGSSNRYFEILLLQKNIPFIMLDGFALVLQTAVGFALVSFYHPWLFIFNTGVVLTIYTIWRAWSSGAKRTAIERSKQKYATAKWLADLESLKKKPTSDALMSEAAVGTEEQISRFIDAQRQHFSYTFPQSLLFLALYALGSAGLLGVGGWLVIEGQLSVGQLVAAELIMASIFLGLSRFSTYLKAYYELYGSADKLEELLSLPEDQMPSTDHGAATGSQKSEEAEIE